MEISFRRYPQERVCPDFYRIIDFLMEHGARGHNKNWHWARWEWLLGHSMLEMDSLPQIGIFESGGKIIGLATHDMRPGRAYVISDSAHEYAKPEMLLYTIDALSHEGKLGLFIDDNDTELIKFAREKSFVERDEKEYTLSLDCCGKKLPYTLSGGYAITDYSLNKDLNKYYTVIWQGFNHEGLPPLIAEADVIDKPHENPKLAVFVSAPGGEYAAHCGTWHDEGSEFAYIEPVVTVPEERRKGLGRVAVYESVNRCAAMGAKKALVISNQVFYHNIGFKAYASATLWEYEKGM